MSSSTCHSNQRIPFKKCCISCSRSVEQCSTKRLFSAKYADFLCALFIFLLGIYGKNTLYKPVVPTINQQCQVSCRSLRNTLSFDKSTTKTSPCSSWSPSSQFPTAHENPSWLVVYLPLYMEYYSQYQYIYIYIHIHTYIHYIHTYITYIHTLHTYIHYIHTYITYIHTLHTYIHYIHTLHTLHYITLHYIT